MAQSFDRNLEPVRDPSDWVHRWASLIRAKGRVLDLAAGDGRHARALAAQGFAVTAVDLDVSGLKDAPCEVVAADLEADPWPFAAQSFDAIVITNYLHRPHFPHLVDTLADNGVLIFETFAVGNEKFGRPRNPAFLLAQGELLAAFAPHLRIVAYEHGAEQKPRPAMRQRLCAVKS